QEVCIGLCCDDHVVPAGALVERNAMLDCAARFQLLAELLLKIDARDLHLSVTLRRVDDAYDHRAALDVVLQVDLEIDCRTIPYVAAKLPEEAVRPEHGQIVGACLALPGVAERFAGLDR